MGMDSVKPYKLDYLDYRPKVRLLYSDAPSEVVERAVGPFNRIYCQYYRVKLHPNALPNSSKWRKWCRSCDLHDECLFEHEGYAMYTATFREDESNPLEQFIPEDPE